MPSYIFLCRTCRHTFEDFLWFSEPLPCKCPLCGEAKEFGQDFTKNRPGGWTYGEDRATTVGQQAAINAKKAGKEQIQKMAEAERERRSGWTGPIPEGASLIPPQNTTEKAEPVLDLNQIKDIDHYILTGEKK